jgi:hypothetical protein
VDAGARDVQQRQGGRGLPAGDRDSGHPAFQVGQAFLDDHGGRFDSRV